jgi:hypothetical protein
MEKFEIYFKVNQSKILNENDKFFNQLQKISKYIIERKKLNVNTLNLNFGTIDDDFLKNKSTIKLTYNLKK